MSTYPQLLGSMMQAILEVDTTPAPTLLREKENFPAIAQLAVYTEGYRIRLMDAVESSYPALQCYMGKSKMAGLVQGYITAHPSRVFNLDKYPIGFAEYVAQSSEDIFARELALLEETICDVYQREETPALEAPWAQVQTPETLAQTPLVPRTASRLLAFSTPVNAYLTTFRADGKPKRSADQKNWMLVLRHKHQVQRLSLQEGEYTLLSLMAEGLTLENALEDMRIARFTEQEEFPVQLQQWFGRWIAEGVLRQPS